MAFSDALKSLESWRGIKHHITYFSKALSLVVVENLDPGGSILGCMQEDQKCNTE